ncbi:hypothetical protein PVAP13_9NG673300 [Panicum virgatum]|uniref:Uncharacterized protein n=1 Tax=Panicum virgatum TaxID=38727 RepID=A0A8T0N226_PANVG|nr:hypothetical protein PVAP13_9NG673300 [Panicum virgatum]
MKDSCSWGGNSPVEETGGKGRLVGGLKNGAITAAVQLRRGGRSTRDRGREHVQQDQSWASNRPHSSDSVCPPGGRQLLLLYGSFCSQL